MPHLRLNNQTVGGALVPYIGPNGNWWIGKYDSGISANFSGSVYTPIKGVDYFTEEDIKEILDKADSTLLMKIILSNIGDMNELSDKSAESLVEAINNYATALRELQLQIIQINNGFVDNHTSKQNIHMPTYYSDEEFDESMAGPVVWNQFKESYKLSEIEEETTTDDTDGMVLKSMDADMDAEDLVYATNESNKFVTVSNISIYDENDDESSIGEGEIVATLNS